MRAWSRVALAVTLVAVLLVIGVPHTAGHPGDATQPTASTLSLSQTSYDAATTYRIDMERDGEARWTVNRTFHLENESHREGFQTVADRFESGEYRGLTVSAFEGAAELASETTSRQMEITNVSRDTTVAAETGSLRLTFTWTNFSYRENGRIHVDDVFRTDARWFPGLAERETLIITRPEGYQFYSASTNVQNRALRWEGPHTFGPDRPYAVFDEIQSTNGNTTTPALSDQGFGTLGFVLGGILLLGTLVAVVYVARRRDEPLFPGDSDDSAGAAARADTQGGESATAEKPDAETGAKADAESGDEPPEEPASDESSGEVPAVAAGSATDEKEGDSEPAIDEELLSDEERVERLLEANGGRMKQANIVDETGWSNAKVSQLLSGMAEEGRIEKLRIGRENLISFPEESVDIPEDT